MKNEWCIRIWLFVVLNLLFRRRSLIHLFDDVKYKVINYCGLHSNVYTCEWRIDPFHLIRSVQWDATFVLTSVSYYPIRSTWKEKTLGFSRTKAIYLTHTHVPCDRLHLSSSQAKQSRRQEWDRGPPYNTKASIHRMCVVLSRPLFVRLELVRRNVVMVGVNFFVGRKCGGSGIEMREVVNAPFCLLPLSVYYLHIKRAEWKKGWCWWWWRRHLNAAGGGSKKRKEGRKWTTSEMYT